MVCSHTNYSKLRVFGYPTYTHNKENKLGLRARKCIFLGYASRIKGYLLWCVDLKSLKTNMDETFDNSIILHKENESIDVGVD